MSPHMQSGPVICIIDEQEEQEQEGQEQQGQQHQDHSQRQHQHQQYLQQVNHSLASSESNEPPTSAFSPGLHTRFSHDPLDIQQSMSYASQTNQTNTQTHVYSDVVEIAGKYLDLSAPIDVCLSSAGLTQISLEVLATVRPENVKSLSLANNALTELDLSPLAMCKNLTSISLNNNWFSSIDLSPLQSLPELEKIWLQSNKLSQIDLSPLEHVPKLRSLYIENNEIHDSSISLKPLSKCKLLKALRLGGNRFAGQIDIAPLFHCSALITFDLNPGVRMIAKVPDTEKWHQGASPLPAAFRKRAVLIEWKVLSKAEFEKHHHHQQQQQQQLQQQQHRDNHTVQLQKSRSTSGKDPKESWQVLSIGFKDQARCALDALLSKVDHIQIDVDHVACGKEASNIVALDDFRGKYKFFIVAPSMQSPQNIIDIRNTDHSAVIFVLGSRKSSSAAEDTSKCLRVGADCVLMEPLSTDSFKTIQDWVFKKSRGSSPSCSPTTVIEQAPLINKSTTLPVSLLINPTTGIDFVKLRLRSNKSNTKFASRARTEESAIKMLFSRSSNELPEAEFQKLATLLGLPVSSSTFLFFSVLQFQEDLGTLSALDNTPVGFGSPVSPMFNVTYSLFNQYYHTHLKGLDSNCRLFNVLRVRKERVVKKDTIEHFISFFMDRNRVYREKWASFQGITRQDLVRTLSELLLHGLGCSGVGGCSLSDFKIHNLGSLFLAAESGICDGILGPLRPDRIDCIVAEFIRASNGKKSTSLLCEQDLNRYSTESMLVTPRAVQGIFSRYHVVVNSQPGFRLNEFARFLVSLSDPGSLASLVYLFPVLDYDWDGQVSASDLVHHFMEKRRLLRLDGYECVNFIHIWRFICDSVFVGREGSYASQDGISFSKVDLKKISEKNRLEIMRGLLFLQDDMALVDIRKSANGQDPSKGLMI